jgi:hypothetical protein
LLRGRRSRNKVSVGEPAEGSITRIQFTTLTYGGRLAARGVISLGLVSSAVRSLSPFFQPHFFPTSHLFLQLLAMDVSAQATMKDAAKCDKRCDWQNSANQENAERILHFQVSPESMSGSGRLYYHVAKDALSRCYLVYVLVRQRRLIRWRMKLSSFAILHRVLLVILSLKTDACADSVSGYYLFSFTYELRQGYPLNLSI